MIVVVVEVVVGLIKIAWQIARHVPLMAKRASERAFKVDRLFSGSTTTSRSGRVESILTFLQSFVVNQKRHFSADPPDFEAINQADWWIMSLLQPFETTHPVSAVLKPCLISWTLSQPKATTGRTSGDRYMKNKNRKKTKDGWLASWLGLWDRRDRNVGVLSHQNHEWGEIRLALY